MAEPGNSPARKRRTTRRSDPFLYDKHRLTLIGRDAHLLAGADEVGRGCFAGPLVAAAVILDYRGKPARELAGLTDSKALSAKTREDLYWRILRLSPRVALSVASAQSIDENGLQRSNIQALSQCLESLRGEYDLALVDGFDLGRPDLRAEAVSSGDWRSAAIAAASVVAKVTRDRLMRALDATHPEYGFLEHVGYGTRGHRLAIREHGLSVLHRRSFAWVAAFARGEEPETRLALGEGEGALFEGDLEACAEAEDEVACLEERERGADKRR